MEGRAGSTESCSPHNRRYWGAHWSFFIQCASEERKVSRVVSKTPMSAPIAPVVEAIRKPKETCDTNVTVFHNLKRVNPYIESLS